MFWRQESKMQRIQSKEESSIWERKSRGSWGSADGQQQEENSNFFLRNQWIFLTVYRQYPFTSFPQKSWHVLWRLIAFHQSGALCTRAVWCTNKRWICLHISLGHWQKPVWLQQSCSANTLPGRGVPVTHQWSVGCSGAQISRLEGEPHLCCPWIPERSRRVAVRSANFCACRYNICLEHTWNLNAWDWSCL